MRKPLCLSGLASLAVVAFAIVGAWTIPRSLAQSETHPAFVIVERLATTGDESIQQEYAALAREILPKYGASYLARSQRNVLLEGDGPVPCCIAVLQFPSLDAARRWYDSPENQAAAKIRQRGGAFRLVAVDGLPTLR
jgi:uncharacterized protein (DUF1330 family)